MDIEQIVSGLEAKVPGAIAEQITFRGERTLCVKAAALRRLLELCRHSLGFDYLVDVSSVDHLGEDPRFEVVYELYSLSHRQHLRVRSRVGEETPELPTVTDLWPTADWHEREIWDMMGIRFSGHPDLRRILMWEGYPYHPLRKEFPLGGKPSEVPGVAFTDAAPLEGGPFVTVPSTLTTKDREPRARGR